MNQKHKTGQARLESLVRISRYHAESLSDLLDYALDEIIALTKSKIGYIFFYNETTRQFTMNTWSKSAREICKIQLPQNIYHLDQTGLWGEAVRQSKPIIVNDFRSSGVAGKGLPEGHPPLRRFMTIPVFSQGSIAAVLGLANKKTAYTESDVREAALMMDSIWPITRRREDEDGLALSRQAIKQALEAVPADLFRKDAGSPDKKLPRIPKETADLSRNLHKIARLAAIAKASEDAIIGTDIHGAVTDWNGAAEKISGYKEEEILGRPLSTLVPPDKQNEIDIITEALRAGQNISSREISWLHKSGRPFYISLSISRILDKKGQAAGLSIIGRDITEKKKSEEELERYRNFIENMGDGCFEIDMNGKVNYVNEVIEKRMGYVRGELIGAGSLDYAGASEYQRLFEIFRRIYDTDEPATIDDFIVRDKDGTTRFVSMTVSLIRDAEGRRIGFRGTTRDVTEKKRTQASLEQSEARYRSIFQNNKAVMLLVDPQTGSIIDANLEACSYYRYSHEQLLGMTLTDLAVRTNDDVGAEILGAKADERSHLYSQHRLAGGEVRPVEVFSGPMEIDGKKLLFSIIHDITERRQAEEALCSSEGKYRSILDNISEGYFECDINGKIVFVNDSGCAMTGYDRETLFRTHYRQFTTPETKKNIQDTFQAVIRTGEHSTMEDYEIIRADGAIRVHQLNVKLIRDAEGRPSGFRVVARDITERKKAEEAMRRSEEKYRSIMDGIMEGYLEYDLNGNITFANDAACTMMGYPREELLGMNYSHIASSQALKLFDQTTRDIIATGAPRKLVDFEIIRKDGSRRIHQHNLSLIRNAEGKPAGLRAMGRDVTELKWAEEALRQSEERIRLLFRNIPVPTFVWKAQHDQYILSEFNSAAFQFIGDKIIDALGKPAREFFNGMPQIAADIARCMEQRRNSENQFWYNFDDRSDKRYVIVKYAFAPPDSVLMHVNDITGQKRAEENLQFISIHDPLTGLFNRFYSDAEINRLAAGRMRPVSIIVIDLNNLKKINDDYGHAMGDLYIKNSANIMKQTFRPEDMIARIGGDEFLVLLPLVDETICAQAVERLNQNIRFFNQESEFPISLSAGSATAQAGDSLLECIREADKRMYEDKAIFKAAGGHSLPR